MTIPFLEAFAAGIVGGSVVLILALAVVGYRWLKGDFDK